jgi:hypothetical protein
MPQKAYRNNENAEPRAYVASAPVQNGQRRGPQEPSGRVVLEGYRDDIMNGFEMPKSRFNPVSKPYPTQELGAEVNHKG